MCQASRSDMGAGASVPATEPALSDAGKAALLTHLQVFRVLLYDTQGVL